MAESSIKGVTFHDYERVDPAVEVTRGSTTGHRGGPVWSRLRALLQLGGATFYDAEGYFVKTPMVALVAIGDSREGMHSNLLSVQRRKAYTSVSVSIYSHV